MQDVPLGLSLCIRATAVVIVASWLFILFLISWPEHPVYLSMTHPTIEANDVLSYRSIFASKKYGFNSNRISPTFSKRAQGSRQNVLLERQGYGSLGEMGYNWRPRVIGVHYYRTIRTASKDIEDSIITSRTHYHFITERIDPYLLSYTSETLHRISLHNSVYNNNTESKDSPIYRSAIFHSTTQMKSEDPLRQLIHSRSQRFKQYYIYNKSEDYLDKLVSPILDEKCEVVPKHATWMLTSFPTCNLFHEFDITHALMIDKIKMKWYGYWRDVWSVPDTATHNSFVRKIAMKTLRFQHEYTERNYDRHRKDALVCERLTSSPSIVNMYGFCGNSGLYQYSSDGTLGDRLAEHIMAVMESENRSSLGRGSGDDSTARQLDPYEKLRIAYQVSLSLADLHDADAMRDNMGRIISAAIVHTDIKPDQFINFDGSYKLTDFNRCRFMRRKITNTQPNGDGEPCGFTVERNPSLLRSPEEYSYVEETEKVDIYSLGNIFYTLLADREPWDGFEEKVAHRMIMKGIRPDLPDASAEFVHVTLRELVSQCFQQDPQRRPRARILADTLSAKISSHYSNNNEKTARSK
ncbi:hypothetical protein HJC23_008083 [Cyclotella cryptica]|uniref:Protein kinase domain-containing protein n=1 Tax=Cyclotella cryptica TaxID=29204 RepID=A0ABD3PGN0_9STRA